MKCYLCNKTAEIKQQKGRAVCNECFSRLIEKRVRKYTRLNKIFRPNDRVLVIGELNKYLVKSIAKGLPIKIFYRVKIDKNFVKKNKINKVIIEWTADDRDNLFLESLFSRQSMKNILNKKSSISLLCVITDKEAKLFAKIKKLKFKENKKNKDVQRFLDDMEKKDPGIKFRLLKNRNFLKSILKA
jgi:hypothetical protein